jgi:hypothetical protein
MVEYQADHTISKWCVDCEERIVARTDISSGEGHAAQGEPGNFEFRLAKSLVLHLPPRHIKYHVLSGHWLWLQNSIDRAWNISALSSSSRSLPLKDST